jgi:hypothetical protein
MTMVTGLTERWASSRLIRLVPQWCRRPSRTRFASSVAILSADEYVLAA